MNHAPEALGERLRRDIEESILAGRLVPGDRIDERTLAERYGVSRTPVREALQQLSMLGLITMKARQSTRIATVELAALLQMFEAMAFMEAQIARLAARRMTRKQIAALQAIQANARAAALAKDANAFNDANWHLHLAIFNGSQNAYLAEQARNLRLRLHPYRCYLVRRAGRMANADAQHEVIVQAITDGDGDRAFEAMSSHINIDSEQMADFAALLSGLQGTEAEDLRLAEAV
jgi:DNA-binding GntR family transcriptional regulator